MSWIEWDDLGEDRQGECSGIARRGDSLARGIALAGAGPHEAVLICLADMPNITPEHLKSIMGRFDPVTAPAVGSAAGGVCSPPTLFGRSLFARIAVLAGDKGARARLVESKLVPAPTRLLLDVDRPGDLSAT